MKMTIFLPVCMFCFSKTIDIFQRHHFPAEQIEWAASGNLLSPAISKLPCYQCNRNRQFTIFPQRFQRQQGNAIVIYYAWMQRGLSYVKYRQRVLAEVFPNTVRKMRLFSKRFQRYEYIRNKVTGLVIIGQKDQATAN